MNAASSDPQAARCGARTVALVERWVDSQRMLSFLMACSMKLKPCAEE